MQISANGVNLITAFENCELTSYQDIDGVWTIGYGHTGDDVFPNQTITHDEALMLLQNDLQAAESAIGTYVTVALQQCQFDALTSFTFNEGSGRLEHSTLLKKLNTGDYQGAADGLLVWDIANKVVSAGLYRRREAERALFLNQDWTVFNNGVA